MENLYSRLFLEIFNACEPYIMHDFLNVRGTGDGNIKYCNFTCVKILDETIKVLQNFKYNGELVLPQNIAFDIKNIIPTANIIHATQSYNKKKIIVENDIITLANARETENKVRIILIPIDGMSSFVNGYSNFSMVLILQQQSNINTSFETQEVVIFNPIRKDIFSFNNNGCFYNKKKIAISNVYKKNTFNVVFVNDASRKISFDLTRLSQIADNLALSSSIFDALVELFTTNNNVCIAKIDDYLLPFIKFACKHALLRIESVGTAHLIIGNDAIVNELTTKR